jgi:peptide methionine sulfoxide reductase msrA/msrB
MYRRVLPLLLTAVLLLSGCTAGQKNMPQKTDEKEMTGQPSDMSGEESMYMDTTENVIYLAGGCFWGMEQLMQSIPGVIDAESGCPRHLRGGRRLQDRLQGRDRLRLAGFHKAH